MRKSLFFSLLISMALGLFVLRCGPGQSEDSGQSGSVQDSSNAAQDSTNDSTQAAKNDKKTDESIDEDLIPVEVTTVTRGDISDYILLSSNLETEVQADVYARIQGIVERVYKEEGQYVKKGDILLSLEAEEYELAEQRARVEYDKQQSNYNRFEEMHSKQLLSDDEFEKAKYALDAARISWEEAKLNLDFMQIQSPISGWIGERLAKVGARIQPVDKLFTVVDNSEVIAVVWVPEKSINQLSVHQPAVLTSDHIQGGSFEGWVKRISPVVDPASGTCKVTVGVRNTNRTLRPGMFVNVHIIVSTHENVVLIPKMAVVYEKEYMNVFVVRDSLAQKIRLNVGFEDNEKIESRANTIEAGDKIIVIGQAGMKDKTRVKVVSERENTLGNRKNVSGSGV